MPTVRIPSLLQSLTAGVAEVEATGATLLAVIDDVDRQFPGIRDRVIEGQAIRQDVMIFIDGDEASDLDAPVPSASEVHLLPAIAGG